MAFTLTLPFALGEAGYNPHEVEFGDDHTYSISEHGVVEISGPDGISFLSPSAWLSINVGAETPSHESVPRAS